MEKIKIKNNEVVLNFNKDFYDAGFIEQAVEDFKGACEIRKIKENIVLKPKNPGDLKIIGYEFYNYVLGLMKNAG